MEIGQLAIKIAGRDAGRECLIVQKVDDNFVLVDGNTRRRKCNIDHLEFSSQKAALKEGASHEEVVKALQSIGVKVLARAPPRQKKAEANPQTEQSSVAPRAARSGESKPAPAKPAKATKKQAAKVKTK